MKKKLTNEHIEKGQRKEPTCCPIALLLKEAMPGIRHITVDVDTPDDDPYPFVKADEHVVEFKHPDKIVAFIRKFDAGKKVEPFWVEWDDF